MLVAVQPTTLGPQEEETIAAYLEAGGRLILLLDPSNLRPVDRWNRLAERLGIRSGPTWWWTRPSPSSWTPYSPMPTLRYHAITRELQERQMRVMLPRARSWSGWTTRRPTG